MTLQINTKLGYEMEKVFQQLNHDEAREATSSIRGYVYQAYQSILAWMRLGEDELLFLEASEDFDVYEQEVVTVIVSIEERLIYHGDKKGVDSFGSKKSLTYLLKKITDLLTTEGDRRLNYADFCQAFDEATMEVMPKGEALILRSMLNRLNPLTNASSVATTNQTIQVLEEPLPLVRAAGVKVVVASAEFKRRQAGRLPPVVQD